MSNTTGTLFRVTSFGESHGNAVGAVIDGCPAGVHIDEAYIRAALARRRPGQSAISTARNEADNFEIISGVFEGKSTGAPVCILIPNTDHRSSDYDALKDTYRPGHADFTYQNKYGIRDHRGGGRSSARITAGWVAAGAIASLFLRAKFPELDITAYVSQVHTLQMSKTFRFDKADIEKNSVRCPDPELAAEMEALILKTKEEGDSLGGVVSCVIENCPAGLGEPVFGKLNTELGKAMLSLNAVKGVQFGEGFDSVLLKGSEMNDSFSSSGNHILINSNHSGGIQGGISNGMPILFDVAFKPTSTIAKRQQTVDKSGLNVDMQAAGRHDPCVVPRAVAIVEALSALVIADQVLLSYSNHI